MEIKGKEEGIALLTLNQTKELQFEAAMQKKRKVISIRSEIPASLTVNEAFVLVKRDTFP